MTVSTMSPHVAPAELCKDCKKVDLIDVRTPVEFREVHVEIARKVSSCSSQPLTFGQDIFPYPLFNRHPRFIAQQAAGFGEVGAGERRVFAARGVKLNVRLLAGSLFNEANEPQHLHRLIVAQVDGLACDARSPHRRDDSSANIADVREVPEHTAVPIQR